MSLVRPRELYSFDARYLVRSRPIECISIWLTGITILFTELLIVAVVVLAFSGCLIRTFCYLNNNYKR